MTKLETRLIALIVKIQTLLVHSRGDVDREQEAVDDVINLLRKVVSDISDMLSEEKSEK